jgi:AraC family transcriptional regulator of adaptative response / DNA-3-methyladenine glycosylase II
VHDDREPMETLWAELRRDPAGLSGEDAMVRASGLSRRRLTAGFREHFHTTPERALVAARVARAEELLGGGATAREAARGAGFEDVAALEAAFRTAHGMGTRAFRALGGSPNFTLSLPDDYLAAPTLRTWGRDPSSLTDRVDGNRITRAFRAAAGTALVEIELARGVARCRVESEGPVDASIVRAAHRLARRTLGSIDGSGAPSEPATFEELVLRRRRTAPLVAKRRGLRIPLTADPFEALTWAVLGQQVNLAFAFTMRRNLLTLAGARAPRGMRAHPTPAELAALDPADLARLQLSRSKARYLVELARAVAGGELALDTLGDASAVRIEEALLARLGVGPWTAAYVMLRGYGLADCLPVGDAGLAQALQRFFALDARPDAATTRALMAPFAPFRSLATVHLWNSLGDTP